MTAHSATMRLCAVTDRAYKGAGSADSSLRARCEVTMKVKFEMFRGSLRSWNSLLTEAADFANSLQPDHLITICHSKDNEDGIVVVWYWG